MRFSAKMSKFYIRRSNKQNARSYFGLIKAFWFNTYHNENLHFSAQKCDRLVFDDFDKGHLMVWRSISGHVFLVAKKLNNGIIK